MAFVPIFLPPSLPRYVSHFMIAPLDSPEAVRARQNPAEQKQQPIRDMEAELEKLKSEADEEDGSDPE